MIRGSKIPVEIKVAAVKDYLKGLKGVKK